MQIVKVGLDKLCLLKKINPRSEIGDVSDLADDIRQNAARHGFANVADGLILPLVVTKLEGDKYGVIAGKRRYSALMMLSESPKVKLPKNAEIACKLYEGDATPEGMTLESVAENLMRENLKPWEIADAACDLRTVCKLSLGQIASRLHLSNGHVNTLMTANDKLIPEARKAWRDGVPPLAFEHVKIMAFQTPVEQAKYWHETVNKASPAGPAPAAGPAKSKPKSRPSPSRMTATRDEAEMLTHDADAETAAYAAGCKVTLDWMLGALSEIPKLPASAPRKPGAKPKKDAASPKDTQRG